MFHCIDDEPIWEDNYKVLTRQQLNIPCLHMMGYANHQSTAEPLPSHYHNNMEFVVMLNGRQQYNVNDRQYNLYGGNIFMTFPYEPHGNNDKHQEIGEYIWFQFDLSTSENFLSLTSPYSEYLFRQLSNYKHRTKNANKKDLDLLRRSFPLLCSTTLLDKLKGYSYFLTFIMNNLCTDEDSLQNESYSPDIQKALDYIHSNLTNNFSLENVAEHCGLSLSRLKNKFKNQVGITPHAYATSLKIDTAKVLLKNPELSITDVALQLNFSSSHHFASVFKKYTGYTPSYFRENRCPDIY